MAQEESKSLTRLKLEEAEYFFEQMKTETILPNPKHFKFNLSAFASASQSVLFVMQSEYKIREMSGEPRWEWFMENVKDALADEQIPTFIKNLRNMLLENKSPSDVYTVVTSSMIFKYNIEGSAPKKEEEKVKKSNSEEGSAKVEPTILYYEPRNQDPIKRYVWYFPDNTKRTNENRRFIVKSCEYYLQRLMGLVREYEIKFGHN